MVFSVSLSLSRSLNTTKSAQHSVAAKTNTNSLQQQWWWCCFAVCFCLICLSVFCFIDLTQSCSFAICIYAKVLVFFFFLLLFLVALYISYTRDRMHSLRRNQYIARMRFAAFTNSCSTSISNQVSNGNIEYNFRVRNRHTLFSDILNRPRFRCIISTATPVTVVRISDLTIEFVYVEIKKDSSNFRQYLSDFFPSVLPIDE